MCGSLASSKRSFINNRFSESFRNRISPAIKDLMFCSFSERNVKVIPLGDCHVLSMVWNKGVRGKGEDRVQRSTCLTVYPVTGSGRSRNKLAVSYPVEQL